MNQFSGGSRQKNKLYTGHLFLKQPRIFIQPSHQPFDLEQKCINLCPSQTCPVQKSSCLLGGSWWISTVSLPMFESFNATYHIGHISLAHFGVAFGFIPVWTTKKVGGLRPTAAKTTGERWEIILRWVVVGYLWVSLYWVYPVILLRLQKCPTTTFLDVQKPLKVMINGINQQTQPQLVQAGFVNHHQQWWPPGWLYMCLVGYPHLTLPFNLRMRKSYVTYVIGCVCVIFRWNLLVQDKMYII